MPFCRPDPAYPNYHLIYGLRAAETGGVLCLGNMGANIQLQQLLLAFPSLERFCHMVTVGNELFAPQA